MHPHALIERRLAAAPNTLGCKPLYQSGQVMTQPVCTTCSRHAAVRPEGARQTRSDQPLIPSIRAASAAQHSAPQPIAHAHTTLDNEPAMYTGHSIATNGPSWASALVCLTRSPEHTPARLRCYRLRSGVRVLAPHSSLTRATHARRCRGGCAPQRQRQRLRALRALRLLHGGHGHTCRRKHMKQASQSLFSRQLGDACGMHCIHAGGRWRLQ